MIQMASVFGEQERWIIRNRVMVGLDRVRQQGKKRAQGENAIRTHLSAGNGMLKVTAMVGVGSYYISATCGSLGTPARPAPISHEGAQGCSTLLIEAPLEERVDPAESGGVAILIER